MKTVLFASAAALSLVCAAPAMAGSWMSDNVSGELGASFQRVDHGVDVNDYVVNGSVAAKFDHWGFQVDARSNEVDGSGSNEHAVDSTVHANYRWSTGLVGVYANYESYSADNGYTGGIEAQGYLPNITLTGAVGFGTSKVGVGDPAVINVFGSLRYFISDTFSVTGDVEHTHLDAGNGAETVFGLRGELQPLPAYPVDVFVNYERHVNSDSGTVFAPTGAKGFDAYNTYQIGARIHFGYSTLKDRDRKGPSLPTRSAVINGLL